MRVSVIIPVYNAERFIETAVRSALEQPETAEVLVIEDGSTDRSLQVCERLAREDDRVRLLRHPGGENRGEAASRNVGVRAARCELVAFLDADDFFLRGRFERPLEMLAANASLDGVYEAVGTQFESEAMRGWWATHRGSNLTTLVTEVPPEQLLDALITYEHGFFCNGGIVVRRALFERTGLFDVDLRMCCDTAMWLKMAAVGTLAGGRLTEPVAMRRMHGENAIVMNRTRHKWYAARMAWTVLRWGLDRRLEHRQLMSMVWQVATLHRELQEDARPRRMVRRVRDLGCLLRLAAWYRPALHVPEVRALAADLLPGSRLLSTSRR